MNSPKLESCLSSSKVIGLTQNIFQNKNSGCSKIRPMVQSSGNIRFQNKNLREIRYSKSNQSRNKTQSISERINSNKDMIM